MRYKELFESESPSEHVRAALSDIYRTMAASIPRGWGFNGSAEIEPFYKDWYRVDIRHWGQWNIPDDVSDEEADGDYDWEVLDPRSHKHLQEIINAEKAKYPDVEIEYSTEEKNWIVIKARQITNSEVDAEKKRIAGLPKRNLYEMLSKKFGGKKTSGIRWVVGPLQQSFSDEYFKFSWELDFDTSNPKTDTNKKVIELKGESIKKVEAIMAELATKYAAYIGPFSAYRPFDFKNKIELDQFKRSWDPKGPAKFSNSITFVPYKPKAKK